MTFDYEPTESQPSPPAIRSNALRRTLSHPIGAITVAYLALVTLAGLLAPWIAPYRPNLVDLGAVNAPPFTPGHLLGADGSGRDILSGLLWATGPTLLACVVVLAVSATIGVTAGLIAGYFRGPFEAGANWVTDMIMSLPGLVLLIALYTLTGPNIMVAMAVFGVLIAPGYYRLVRAMVHSVRNELYVDAARVAGISDRAIIARHVLWAVRAPIIIQSSFVLSAGIAINAGLGLLGLGNPAEPSWGGMLQEATGNMYSNLPSVVWPTAVITATILCLVLLGNVLRDVLQPGQRHRPLTRRESSRLRERLATEIEHASTRQPASDALLSVRDLRIAYPQGLDEATEVVHGVDLDVRRGEIRGLIGESGSGKTQTAFAILGILPTQALIVSGSILFDDVDLVASPTAARAARGRRIGYIPQEPMANLDPSFTIGRQLVEGLRATKKVSRSRARSELLDLLDRVGIADPTGTFDLYPHQISGGMAQRVLICGAVAAEPDIIIADEPTTALDVTVQAEVLELLRALRDERGLGMLLVTHNFGVVADLCDSVSVMKDGLIVESADVRTVFESPAHPYTQELLASTRHTSLEGVDTHG